MTRERPSEEPPNPIATSNFDCIIEAIDQFIAEEERGEYTMGQDRGINITFDSANGKILTCSRERRGTRPGVSVACIVCPREGFKGETKLIGSTHCETTAQKILDETINMLTDHYLRLYQTRQQIVQEKKREMEKSELKKPMKTIRAWLLDLLRGQ